MITKDHLRKVRILKRLFYRFHYLLNLRMSLNAQQDPLTIFACFNEYPISVVYRSLYFYYA